MTSAWVTLNEHRPTDVYRVFDVRDRLLYVGMTTCWPARVSMHRSKTPWWGEAHAVQLTTYTTRSAALAAEIAAIKTEHPVHNVRHSRGEAA